MSSSAYRPDIDGLRAVAVLLVLFFHAGLGPSGGYVGVDVFFVISGYLITGKILRDQSLGNFSLAEFWTRRIRRIVPAATCMTAVTLAVGALLLIPDDYEELAESSIAQLLMVANVFFWQNTDYFDGPAELKPLLHTWSLAVEEQFYIVFPVLLMFAGRYGRRVLISMLVTIGVASLAISVWSVAAAPTGAFFLLPSRAWELLLGSGLCLLPPVRSLSTWRLHAMSSVGLLAIAVAAICYGTHTDFPGIAAILPCGGAALLIYAHQDGRSWAGRCLSHGALVRIGMWSYSLYLWHWPVLVFLRYRLGEDVTPIARSAGLLLSGLLGYLSWRFIETPFRRGIRWQSRPRVAIAFASTTAALLLAGWFVQQADGLPERFSPEAQKLYAAQEPPRFQKFVSMHEVADNRLPQFGDRSGSLDCLIWGDSHAMAIIPALDESCRDLGIRGYQATYGGTLPLVDFPTDRKGAAPEQYDEAVLDLIAADEFDIVILAGYWSRDSDHPRFFPSLQETIEELTAAGVRVIVMRDVPVQEDTDGLPLAAPLHYGADVDEIGVKLDEHRRHQRSADAAIASLAGTEVMVIDPAPLLLNGEGRCSIVMDGELLYSDRHHLSIAGARRLKPLFSEVLSTLKTASQPTPQ